MGPKRNSYIKTNINSIAKEWISIQHLLSGMTATMKENR